MKKQFSRRDFLKLAGGAAVTVAGVGILPQFLRKTLAPVSVAGATEPYDLFFAGTDGWFSLPEDANAANLAPFFPDTLAPAPFNTYIFGFRNVTHLNDIQRQNQKEKAQHNTPFFWVDQETEFRMRLTNLGLALRPDLTDAHTLHWHGFRNVIPFYDGEPSGSLSVPVGQHFTYVYKPHDAGTYMYHCHVEDIEHVTMGMTGIVFVRAAFTKNPTKLALGSNRSAPNNKDYLGFAYNDDSTGYDREFALLLSEIWAKGHWNDAHIQESDWSTFKADFSLINGRVYPQTLLPNGQVDLAHSAWGSGSALTIQTDANGELLPPDGHPELQYNPHSALVTCNAGEKVLLRFANLGFREAAMTLAGITMRVVGRDATPMRGIGSNGTREDADSADTSYETDTLLFGAGESFDVIFEAPVFSGGSGSSGNGYDVYMLYNRRYTQEDSSHGQRTEVRVYPAGALGAQQYLNQHPGDTAA